MHLVLHEEVSAYAVYWIFSVSSDCYAEDNVSSEHSRYSWVQKRWAIEIALERRPVNIFSQILRLPYWLEIVLFNSTPCLKKDTNFEDVFELNHGKQSFAVLQYHNMHLII